MPHHVTQRGNRRETVFFSDADYELYRGLLAMQCRKHEVAVWSYCLMPNHVHLILVPARAESLGRALGETHRRYSAAINADCASPAICSNRATARRPWTKII